MKKLLKRLLTNMHDDVYHYYIVKCYGCPECEYQREPYMCFECMESLD